MKILSFDQASKVSGYAVFVDGDLVDHGKFEFDDANVDTRLTKIRNQVQELIAQHQPDLVLYEEIQEQNNIQTFKILAMVYGVFSQLFDEMQVEHKAISASTWKSQLGIKGRQRAEQKRNAQQFVLDHYGVKVIQDTADAICIGASYIVQNKCAW